MTFGATWQLLTTFDVKVVTASSNIDWKLAIKASGESRRIDPYHAWLDASAGDLVGGTGSQRIDQEVDLITVLVELPRNSTGSAGYTIPSSVPLVPTHLHDTGDTSRRGWGRVRSCVIPRNSLGSLQAAVGTSIVRYEVVASRTRSADEYVKTLVKLLDSKASDFLIRNFNNSPLLPVLNQLLIDLNKPELTAPGRTHITPQRAEPEPPRASPEQPPARAISPNNVPVVGIIDDLCNFAAPHLIRPDGTSAVTALWDQGADEARLSRISRDANVRRRWAIPIDDGAQGKPATRRGTRNGREFRPSESATDRGFDADSESAVYRRVGYRDVFPRWGHGAVVMDLIAGRNKASIPEVLFVQLPEPTVEDTSGGSLAAHALDGIHHLLDWAHGRKLVVNLSYGTFAGPHDGTSLFETGLKDLLSHYDNLHVVLPAGNNHLSRTHSTCGVGVGSKETLLWQVLPDDPTDSFLEIWLPSAEGIRIEVSPPSGEGRVVKEGESYSWRSEHDKTDYAHAAVIYPRSVAQGDVGTMCLVAVAPTRRGSDLPLSKLYNTRRRIRPAPHGVWRITVHNNGLDSVRFHAWIQRDDPVPGRFVGNRPYRGRQSRFIEDANTSVDARFTLNGIATLAPCPRLRVVGAMRASDKGVSEYSSAGPNRDEASRFEGPDMVVIADDSLAVPGLLLCGTLGSTRVRVGGTSIAAAAVSGLLYQHLLKKHTADSFRFRGVDEPTLRPLVAAGEPVPSNPWHRGETERVEPEEVIALLRHRPSCTPRSER